MAMSVVCYDYILQNPSALVDAAAYDHVILDPASGDTVYFWCRGGMQNYVQVEPELTLSASDYDDLLLPIIMVFVVAFGIKMLRGVFDTGTQRY